MDQVEKGLKNRFRAIEFRADDYDPEYLQESCLMLSSYVGPQVVVPRDKQMQRRLSSHSQSTLNNVLSPTLTPQCRLRPKIDHSLKLDKSIREKSFIDPKLCRLKSGHFIFQLLQPVLGKVFFSTTLPICLCFICSKKSDRLCVVACLSNRLSSNVRIH